MPLIQPMLSTEKCEGAVSASADAGVGLGGVVAWLRTLARRDDLEPATLRLAALIAREVDSRTGVARIHEPTAAERLGCDVRKLRVRLQELQDLGFARCARRGRESLDVRVLPGEATWAALAAGDQAAARVPLPAIRRRRVGVAGAATAAGRSDLALVVLAARDAASGAAGVSGRFRWACAAIVAAGASAEVIRIILAIEAAIGEAGAARLSVDALAARACCARRSVSRAMQRLEAAGWLATTRQIAAGLGGTEGLSLAICWPERWTVLEEQAREHEARLALVDAAADFSFPKSGNSPRRAASHDTFGTSAMTLSARQPCQSEHAHSISLVEGYRRPLRGDARRRAPARPPKSDFRSWLEEELHVEVGDLDVAGLQAWCDAWLGRGCIDVAVKATRHAASGSRRALVAWVVEDVLAELDRLGLLAAAGEAERRATLAALRAAAPVVAVGEMTAGEALQAAIERAAVDRGQLVSLIGVTIFHGPRHEVGGRFAAVTLADVAALRARHGASVELVEIALGVADAAVGDLARGAWRLSPDQRYALLLASASRLLEDLEAEAIRRADLAPEEVPAAGRVLPALAVALALAEDLGLEVPLAKLSPTVHETAIEEIAQALEAHAGIICRRSHVVAVTASGRDVLGRDVGAVAPGRNIEPALAAHAANLAEAFGGDPADALGALEWHGWRHRPALPLEALPAAARRAAIAAAGPGVGVDWWHWAQGAYGVREVDFAGQRLAARQPRVTAPAWWRDQWWSVELQARVDDQVAAGGTPREREETLKAAQRAACSLVVEADDERAERERAAVAAAGAKRDSRRQAIAAANEALAALRAVAAAEAAAPPRRRFGPCRPAGVLGEGVGYGGRAGA